MSPYFLIDSHMNTKLYSQCKYNFVYNWVDLYRMFFPPMAEYSRAGGFIGRYSWTLCSELWLPQQGVWSFNLVFVRSRIAVSTHASVILWCIVVSFSHPEQIPAKCLIFLPHIFNLRLTNQLRNAWCSLSR